MKFKIVEFVSQNKGITPEEGTVIYTEIMKAFNENQKVILDFKGVEMLTTAYLNAAIGALYKDYTSEQLKTKIDFENLDDVTAFRIKKVTDNAKLFYKNSEGYEETVNKALNENS